MIDNHFNDFEVQRDAKIIDWECLKECYRPLSAMRSAVEKVLGQTAKDRIQHLERLHLIQTKDEAEEQQIHFALDPLAEYLAALRLVEGCKQDDARWKRFLAHAQSQPGAPKTISGFLMAVRDCILRTPGIKIPDSVQEYLDSLFHILEQAQARLPIVREEMTQIVKVADRTVNSAIPTK